MQLDPSRWLVSLAGFLFDWIITREWSRALRLLTPIFILLGAVLLVGWGNRLDRHELAGWYLELGEQEIADWEATWAPKLEIAPGVEAGDAATSEGGSDAGLVVDDDPDAAGNEDDTREEGPSTGKASQVSRFAEVLFRRVQLLNPSDRSQFVIGATLAQRGAVGQATAMLTKIAPDDARGYAPAHAFLAELYWRESRDAPPTAERLEALKHHVWEAQRWERVPRLVLRMGTELFFVSRQPDKSLALLAQSAARNPEDNLELARLAKAAGNERQFHQAFEKAEAFLKEALQDNPRDDVTRLKLVELYTMKSDLDRAEAILQGEGEASPVTETQNLRRGLSEIYRLRFLASESRQGDKYSADIRLLDAAMRIDPTNPLIAEQVAKLVRFQSVESDNELIDLLQTNLAEGNATVLTHVWLAETYLDRKLYAKAIPHLQQVVQRLPNAVDALNNLAYVIADLYPERLDEALGYAQRAVDGAAAVGNPNADFYDTLGIIFSKLDRSQEAIAAFETAIEISRGRIDFRKRLAAEYRKQGNTQLADKQLAVVERLETSQLETEPLQ